MLRRGGTANFSYYVEYCPSTGRGRPALDYVITEGLALLLLSGYRKPLLNRMALLQAAEYHFKGVVYH